MKHFVWVVMAVLVVSAGPTRAQKQLGFEASPILGTYFGDTRFKLNVEDVLDGETVGLGSELIYPLDMTKAGVRFGMRVTEGGRCLWTGDLRVLLAVNDPGEKMTDVDWISVNDYRWEFSSTRSPVDGSATELEFKGTRLIYAARNFELAGLIGFNIQKINQKMMGFEGWQRGYDDQGHLYVVVVSYDKICLTYEVRYVRPMIGIVQRLVNGPWNAELQAILSPLTHVKDIDDHVLRSFQIRTDGNGLGYGGKLGVRYGKPVTDGVKPFVSLSGEFFKVSIDVDGYRNYYADNVEEGAVKGDIFAESHTISTTQYGVQLSAGLAF
jgi:hypothetical protein